MCTPYNLVLTCWEVSGGSFSRGRWVHRTDTFGKLAKVLKPGGRVVVIDFHKKPLPVGPPESMKLSDREVITELQKAGFTLSKRLDVLPYQYFLFFERR